MEKVAGADMGRVYPRVETNVVRGRKSDRDNESNSDRSVRVSIVVAVARRNIGVTDLVHEDRVVSKDRRANASIYEMKNRDLLLGNGLHNLLKQRFCIFACLYGYKFIVSIRSHRLDAEHLQQGLLRQSSTEVDTGEVTQT